MSCVWVLGNLHGLKHKADEQEHLNMFGISTKAGLHHHFTKHTQGHNISSSCRHLSDYSDTKAKGPELSEFNQYMKGSFPSQHVREAHLHQTVLASAAKTNGKRSSPFCQPKGQIGMTKRLLIEEGWCPQANFLQSLTPCGRPQAKRARCWQTSAKFSEDGSHAQADATSKSWSQHSQT